MSQSSSNPLVILVKDDVIFDNPYTLSIINPDRFDESIETKLQSKLDFSYFFASWFIQKTTSDYINSYKILNKNLFSSEIINQSLIFNNISKSDLNGEKITLGITTSFDNSGLFDYLLDSFKMQSPLEIIPIVKSSNAILLDADNGNFNIIITHSPILESEYDSKGLFKYRQTIFRSQFCIIGPQIDPAGINGITNASRAFELIMINGVNEGNLLFVSRGDYSGTHAKELEIWKTINRNPETLNWASTTEWYIIGGGGQSGTYRLTLEKQGYTIIDLPTYYMNLNLENDGLVEGFITAINLIITLDLETWDIIFLSFSIHLIAISLAIITAIPFAFLSQKYNFIGKDILLIFSNTLMAIPPVVLGLILWIIFSNSGPLGSLQILFTSPLMIISQFILAFPIIFSITFTGFDSIDQEFYDQIRKYNLNKRTQFILVLNEKFSNTIIAIISAFSRILGEVGAMLIIGGNIRWQTRVLTTSIVNELESGEISTAIALGMILIAVALLMNILLVSFQTGKSLLSNNTKIRFNSYMMNRDTKNIELDQSFNLFSSYSKTKEFKIEIKEGSYSPSTDFILTIPSFTISNKFPIGVTGFNASGKTTLLRLIVDELDLQTGNLTKSNKDMKIEFASQNPILFNTSVYKNLKYALDKKINTKTDIINKIMFISSYFDIEQYLAYPVGILSKGNSKKVAIARTFLKDADLYLLDEIFINLDIKSVELVKEIIKQLRTHNKGFLIVSHNKNLLDTIVEKKIDITKGFVSESYSNGVRDE